MATYITSLGAFLPGPPISNEEVDDYIGSLGPAWVALRERVMHNSGIRTRHYAIDKEQNTAYSNAQMAAEAVRDAADRGAVELDDIDLLCVASTVPDLIAPGAASMVHGELGSRPCEIVSVGGICASGLMALKHAHLHVSQNGGNAVACASELASRLMKSSSFDALRERMNGDVAAEMAFLRYMLSDGAGAALVQPDPAPHRTSLRIEWISLTSYANTTAPCMYMGGGDRGALKAWSDYPTVADAAADGAFTVRQQLRLLPRLVKVGVDEYERLLSAGSFDPASVRYVAAHYSSEAMRPAIQREIARRGCPVPADEAWYTNLQRVGNVGCAAMYLILEELVSKMPLDTGDQILCFVPESGRFSIGFMLLTVEEMDRLS